MDKPELNRREFQRLAGAALGGMMLGAGVLESSLLAADENPVFEEKKSLMLSEPHVCRGLNTCKGKGADKKNSCTEPARAPRPKNTAATKTMLARVRGAAAPIPAKTLAKRWANAACRSAPRPGRKPVPASSN